MRWEVPSDGGAQCFPPGEELVASVLVPSWMFDVEVCASTRLEASARVSVEVLLELRRLLEVVRSGDPVFEVDSTVSVIEAPMHAQCTSKAPTSAQVDRAPTDTDRLGEPACTREGGGASAPRRSVVATRDCKRRGRSRKGGA